MLKSKFKRCGLIALGTLSLAIGVVGIALPVLPTTPFLLTTSFCYLRGSRSLHDWLLNHRVLGRLLLATIGTLITIHIVTLKERKPELL